MPHALRADLVIEHVDNDVLVLDGQSSTVHRFTGSHAEAIKHLDAGENIEAFSTELADLDAAGLLETESEGSAVSRRGVLLGGSALAGSAALAMSMPGVASAQSPGGGPEAEPLPASMRVEYKSFGSSPSRIQFALFDFASPFDEGTEWTLEILSITDSNGDAVNPSPTSLTFEVPAGAADINFGTITNNPLIVEIGDSSRSNLEIIVSISGEGRLFSPIEVDEYIS